MLLRNDQTDRLLQDLVEGLHALEEQSDSASWDKARLYQPVDKVLVQSGRWSKLILKTIRAGVAL